jgi:monoterpene epsilon-lactone hydrolase
MRQRSLAILAACALPGTGFAADATYVDSAGTIHSPAYELPVSGLLDGETQAALKAAREPQPQASPPPKACPSWAGAERSQMAAIRTCEAEAFYVSASYKQMRGQFDVTITPQEIGGVHTEVVLPAQGVAKENTKRVLINVHGGAFLGGARTLSRLESIPIASVGRIRVVSVDYRMAPEYAFPAASEDVAAVYRALLKTYKPANIGIYGCSAGGLLTAESIAWFVKQHLPLPGAIGMLCEGAAYWTEGDSGHLVYDVSGQKLGDNPYFKHIDPNDPLAFPARSRALMGKFPPTLLVSGTRDFALSSVVYTHSLLVSQKVEANLHVWEGLDHAFHLNPALPESREVYRVTVDFFDKHLGSQ